MRNNGMADEAGELYRTHASGALRCARRLLGSEADAREVVHDVFLSLLQNPEQYIGATNLKAFLYGAVTHAALNRIRRRSTHVRTMRDDVPDAMLPALVGAHPEDAAILRSALERLPQTLAQVAVYYYLHECTQDEIASILGCSRRHVGDLVRRLDDWTRLQLKESEHPLGNGRKRRRRLSPALGPHI